MNQIYFIIYVIATFFIAIYLTIKSNSSHKYIAFIISYWILAQSVLNTEYFIIDIKSLPFDLQLNRIILILFLCYLVLILIQNSKNRKDEIIILKFEKYLYFYILSAAFVSYIHARHIVTLQDFIVVNTSILTFLVIYLVLKRTADEGMIKAICKAFLIVCSISSVIGIFQFIINPYFFRLGSYRVAFSIYQRSNGVFHAEYIQSYFLISGIILALFVVRSKKLKYFLVSLFFTAIIFTFHRMSWIIAIILITLYFFKFKKKEMWKMVSVGTLSGILIFWFLFMFFPEINKLKNSALFQDRLLSDTMTLRIKMYDMILNSIPKNWLLGFGDRDSDVYYYGMLAAGAGIKFAKGEKGGIHNGFLQVIFFRGIIVFILYCMFFIFVFDYFWFLARIKSFIFYIPLFVMLKFILANMTNSFTLASGLGLLLAISLGISVSINKNNIKINNEIEY